MKKEKVAKLKKMYLAYAVNILAYVFVCFEQENKPFYDEKYTLPTTFIPVELSVWWNF